MHLNLLKKKRKKNDSKKQQKQPVILLEIKLLIKLQESKTSPLNNSATNEEILREKYNIQN